eukprot:TRINITY_DN9537_c0_g1_i5.p1 TRINITY_DN9537_c0_g1~~TRINITY_DN9537_c0_g1_i5.p1  ORF type:complete len:117 (+),score=22.06 TRINITY_DN9537_c0_g1_i5:138-488(+)
MQPVRQSILSRKTKPDLGRNKSSVEIQYEKEQARLDTARLRREARDLHYNKVFRSTKEERIEELKPLRETLVTQVRLKETGISLQRHHDRLQDIQNLTYVETHRFEGDRNTKNRRG